MIFITFEIFFEEIEKVWNFLTASELLWNVEKMLPKPAALIWRRLIVTNKKMKAFDVHNKEAMPTLFESRKENIPLNCFAT